MADDVLSASRDRRGPNRRIVLVAKAAPRLLGSQIRDGHELHDCQQSSEHAIRGLCKSTFVASGAATSSYWSRLDA